MEFRWHSDSAWNLNLQNDFDRWIVPDGSCQMVLTTWEDWFRAAIGNALYPRYKSVQEAEGRRTSEIILPRNVVGKIFKQPIMFLTDYSIIQLKRGWYATFLFDFEVRTVLYRTWKLDDIAYSTPAALTQCLCLRPLISNVFFDGSTKSILCERPIIGKLKDSLVPEIGLLEEKEAKFRAATSLIIKFPWFSFVS